MFPSIYYVALFLMLMGLLILIFHIIALGISKVTKKDINEVEKVGLVAWVSAMCAYMWLG